MSSRRYLIIINPAAGRHGLALAESVVAAMRRLGVNPELYYTRGPGDAIDYLRSHAAQYDVVVAAGGDGTVNEVINGLDGRAAILGLIPGGTTNVLATELAYPSGADELAQLLVHGCSVPVFPARVNGRRFSMMTGIGYDAWVVAGVNHAIKKRFGKLAYVLSMLKQLRAFGAQRYRVTVDGVAHEASSMVITNGQHYAGHYILTRQTDLSTPALQVILVQTDSAWRFLGMLLLLPLGMVERLSFIRSLSGRHIRVELAGESRVEPVQADGDTVSTLPAEIRVEELPLQVLAP